MVNFQQEKYNFKILFIIWLCIIGFAGILPILWIRYTLGTDWNGVIPNYITDSTFYLDRINKTISDFPFSGNHYYLEHRFDPQPVFSIAETIVALPMKLGISFNGGLMLGFIVANILFTLFVYKFLRNFVDRLWAVGIASLVYIVSYGGLVRPVVMETIMPVFIFFNWAMFGWFLRPEKKKYGIFLMVAIASAFYLYSYLWQVIVLTVVFVGLYLLATKQRDKFFGLLQIFSLSLALATPAIFYTLKISFLSAGYWENMQRVGFVATHLPPIEAYYYGRWLIVSGLIWFLLFKEQLKDKTAASWYFLIVNAAIFLALVSNIITGKDFLIATHVNRFVITWFALMLGLEIYYFATLKLWRGKIYITILTSFLILAGSMTIFAEMRRSVVPPFALPYTEAVAVQDYRAPLAWLDAHESEPKVIWAGDSMSRFVPYLSKHYVLYPGLLNAHFYIMPTSEIRERYLVSRYFHNPDLETLRREYVYYEGSYFDYKMNDLELRKKLCATIKFNNNFCQSQLIQNLVSQKNSDIMAVYELEMTSIRPHIQEYLKKYHVSYFIRDIVHDPIPTRSVSMVPVYNDGLFEIYKINTP